jgi:hypothetical protein
MAAAGVLASLLLCAPAAPPVSGKASAAPSRRQLLIAGGSATAVLGLASLYFYSRSSALYDDARAMIDSGCGGASCLMPGTQFSDDTSLQLNPDASGLDGVYTRYGRLAQGQQLNRSLMVMTSILALGASVMTAASLR